MDAVTKAVLEVIQPAGITVTIEKVGELHAVTARDESGHTWVVRDRELYDAVVQAAVQAGIEVEG